MSEYVCWVCGKPEGKCKCSKERRFRAEIDKDLRKAALAIHIREHPLGGKKDEKKTI